MIHSEQHSKKLPHLKTLGHESVRLYWYKELTSIHDRLAREMNRYLEKTQILFTNPSARAGYDTRSIFLSGV